MAKLTRMQEKAIFSKLKKEGTLRKKPIKIRVEGQFIRLRVENPKKFQKKSFRRFDVGEKGGTELIIARPHGMTTTRTQAVIVPKAKFFDGTKFHS